MAARKPAKDRPGTPIDNRNFLAPTGFKFSLKRSPGVAFFCNQANIPSLDLGIAIQPTYLKDIDVPGDKIQFGDLTLRFLVDEDLVNYMEIQNWIRGLGYPESVQEFDRLENEAVLPGNFGRAGDNIYSDGTLQILSSNLVAKFNVNFKDMFPYSLSTITFDATDTDIEYFTADVSFKYTIYNLTDLSNKLL
jgi:hypothetical protein|tara:strand:- start:227 stop:802 length:576 start_codon:yes stop_codon:yes gene_type:complete